MVIKSKVPSDGYIKFNCSLMKGTPPKESDIKDLNLWRTRLFDVGLIGMYDNGVGFGNISKRSSRGFIISGTATGHARILVPDQYVEVTKYSLEKNSLECVGRVNASSESLTHAAIYKALPETNAVIHVHSLEAWSALLNKVPTTLDVPYGTPEMAREMMRLIKEGNAAKDKIIVMAGHKEGIISFGADLEDAGNALLANVGNVLGIKRL